MVILIALKQFATASAIILFCHSFYDAGFCWSKKKCIVLLAVSLLTAAIVTYFEHGVFSYISYILLTIAAVYDYRGKKKTGFIFFILLIYLLYGWSNLVGRAGYNLIFPEAGNIFSSAPSFFTFEEMQSWFVMSDEEFLEMYASLDTNMQPLVVSDSMNVFSNILGIIFFGSASLYLYYRLYRYGIIIKCPNQDLYYIIGYHALSMTIFLCFVLFGVESRITFGILSVMSMLLALLFPLFVYSTRISEFYRDRTAAQEQYMQAELAHFQQYRQTQEETSRFRHDIRNNLLCINSMLQQGKSEEASDYLTDLMTIVESLSKKYVTGDPLLDSIVGVKAQAMEQNSIHFELDGVLAGGLQWKPMDICSVFANAIDNAIEATMKVEPEKRCICMNIKSTPQFWFVTITNPVAEAVDISKIFQKNGGYTSKSKSDQHGIGTYNMKYTVESYGAMLKAECTEETFTLEIMIDKSGR